jgi:thymidylate synthase (FAD)
VATTDLVLTDDTIRVLDHGFVRLDDVMASDLSVVNAARVSFARRKEEMDDADAGLIRFLMRDHHGTPFEHNAFRFHIRCPIFVAREWMRHRVGCLTGETEVTFVNGKGMTSPYLHKTVDELWKMWTEGESNGHALPQTDIEKIDLLTRDGLSIRAIATSVGRNRRGVSGHLRGTNARRDARWRVRRMRLRVLNEETKEFETGHVSDVVDKGFQPVYQVSLADGKQLTVTENHRVLTDVGWQTVREAVGLQGDGETAVMTRPCALMTNGAVAHRDRDWLAEQRAAGKSVGEMAAEAGCSYYTIRKWLAQHDLQFAPREATRGRQPWNKGLRYRTGMQLTPKHKAAIRTARSGERSNIWRGGVTTDRASIGRWTREQAPKVHEQFGYRCQGCRGRGGRLHAHHIIPVWVDSTKARELGNLITLCDQCHRGVHRTRDAELEFAREFAGFVGHAKDIPLRTRGWKLTARAVRVASIAYVGLRQTYDLCVDGPWHNFVANGLVVHNSFNEFSMRYARATDEFYVPDADDVRSQVGKPGAYTFDPVEPELAEQTREALRDVYEHAYATYERLVEAGVAREVARSVLPVGAYTEFYWTVNARSLMNFVSLRASETAQREIRRYAEAVERFLEQHMPITYAAFVASGRVSP